MTNERMRSNEEEIINKANEILHDVLVLHRQYRFFPFWRDSPPVGQGLLTHEVSKSHTTTHHSR